MPELLLRLPRLSCTHIDGSEQEFSKGRLRLSFQTFLNCHLGLGKSLRQQVRISKIEVCLGITWIKPHYFRKLLLRVLELLCSKQHQAQVISGGVKIPGQADSFLKVTNG